MGGNAAEAHPCGFKWVTEAKAHNKATSDRRRSRASRARRRWPTFTRRSAPGRDIAFLGGVINYLLTNDKIQQRVRQELHRRHVHREANYAFKDGIFSGYNAGKRSYDKSTWDYELGEDGYAVVDPTLQHPRCVYQNLMKQHYSRYTPGDGQRRSAARRRTSS